MMYWSGVSKKLTELKLPECNVICPLSKYKDIVQPLLSNEKEYACSCSNTLSEETRNRLKKVSPRWWPQYLHQEDDIFSFKYGHEAIA